MSLSIKKELAALEQMTVGQLHERYAAERHAEPQPGRARARAQASPSKPGRHRKQSGANRP